INRRHANDWARLAANWKQAGERFLAVARAVDQECRRLFPNWSDPVWNSWQPPATVPAGIPLGGLELSLERIPHAVPQDPQLPKIQLNGVGLPALLPFPEKSAVLLEAVDQGRQEAVAVLQNLLLRFLTAVPPGKVRLTIVDPVGRGENFAAFMHLADHDEHFVTSRIWTEASDIEQRLSDLTAHMENVIQKYLRNQFQTLEEYNAQAGEVAEPYRILVVADFPVNFTPDAARRLISLAASGARCGIYRLITVDARQAPPQGIDLADLERACSTLV